jgi:hypothetical protein
MASMKAAFGRAWALPLLNLMLWHVGLVMNMFGGTIDHVGARICGVTYVTAAVLVVSSLVVAVVWRRGGPIWIDWIPAVAAVVSMTVINLESAWFLRESAS